MWLLSVYVPLFSGLYQLSKATARFGSKKMMTSCWPLRRRQRSTSPRIVGMTDSAVSRFTTKLLLPLLSTLLLVDRCSASKRFDDSVLYKFNWPGANELQQSLTRQYHTDPKSLGDAAVFVSTGQDEKYLCALPQEGQDETETSDIDYAGPSPGELLMQLYTTRSCTYRIEMYWTYELCHGRFLQQYHEEKDLHKKEADRTEYYLGQFMSDVVAEDDKKFDHLNPPKRKIEDQFLPVYPVRYIQGTLCDISSKPRQTTVFYVCMHDGKNQIYSLDEVSSCEYELIVLTGRLCSHPAFRPKGSKEHSIDCYPFDTTVPAKPNALTLWEYIFRKKEQRWYHKDLFTVKVRRAARSTEAPDSLERRESTTTPSSPRSSSGTAKKTAEPPPVDSSLASAFLSGEYCLYGGSGWWKHEYCHGKQVIQFHEDESGRTEIMLGRWDREKHLSWITDKAHKRPVVGEDGQVRQVSHYYQSGDTCELAGQRRVVEVRLRCRESKGNSNAVTLYLIEPKTCEYILGVESQMFCELLSTADEFGLFVEQQT